VHQLLVLDPPKKTIKALEKIQKGFLWEGKAAANGGNCHVNWQLVCRPTDLGRLGVQDLELTGLALRLRWLWLDHPDRSRAWSGLGIQPSSTERELFFASTHMVLGNGQSALFWEDRWIDGHSVREIAPLLYDCIPKRRHKIRTVADGLASNSWARDIQGVLGIPEVGQYLLLWLAVTPTVLSEEEDRLI